MVEMVMVTLEFFRNNAGDPSGFGEGEQFIGSTVVATNGSCQGTFDVAFPGATTSTQVVTATNAVGDTSEFSGAMAAIAFEYPASGQFVIGDLAPHATGQSVNFWGAQWDQNNPLSAGAGPGNNAFKGFDNAGTGKVVAVLCKP